MGTIYLYIYLRSTDFNLYFFNTAQIVIQRFCTYFLSYLHGTYTHIMLRPKSDIGNKLFVLKRNLCVVTKTVVESSNDYYFL